MVGEVVVLDGGDAAQAEAVAVYGPEGVVAVADRKAGENLSYMMYSAFYGFV